MVIAWQRSADHEILMRPIKPVGIRNFLYADSVIGIKYGPDDLRSYKGNQPAFATKTGTEWGMKSFWATPLSIDPKQVDVVLGTGREWS